MAFKMKGAPYPKLFGNKRTPEEKKADLEAVHGAGSQKTEAEKLAERKATRVAEGKPVGLKDNVKKFAGDLVGAVGGAVNEVGTGVAKTAQDLQSSVEGAGKTIKEGLKKNASKNKAKNEAYKRGLNAHKANIAAWKEGGKSVKRHKRKDSFAQAANTNLGTLKGKDRAGYVVPKKK